MIKQLNIGVTINILQTNFLPKTFLSSLQNYFQVLRNVTEYLNITKTPLQQGYKISYQENRLIWMNFVQSNKKGVSTSRSILKKSFLYTTLYCPASHPRHHESKLFS